jgi:hypothetical protein
VNDTRLIAIGSALLLACGSAAAQSDTKPLSATDLYTKTAHDCHPVDLATWRHPTKQVLIKHKVPLQSLELCNNDAYPIFHVQFPGGEPRIAYNNPFYLPFIADMFVANGRHSMAFVAASYGVIVTVTNEHGSAAEGLEEYKP